MKACELLKNCPFFNAKMKDMPAASELFKKKYCLNNNSECARYLVYKAMGREKVPIDLFPNQKDVAISLIGHV